MKRKLILVFGLLLLLTGCKTHNHTYKENWSWDSEYHYHEALCCDEVSDKEEHEFSDWEVIKEATTTEEGLKVRKCLICEYEESEVLPLHVHEFGEWIVKREPTTIKTGLEERTCSGCFEKESREIPLLEPLLTNLISQDKVQSLSVASFDKEKAFATDSRSIAASFLNDCFSNVRVELEELAGKNIEYSCEGVYVEIIDVNYDIFVIHIKKDITELCYFNLGKIYYGAIDRNIFNIDIINEYLIENSKEAFESSFDEFFDISIVNNIEFEKPEDYSIVIKEQEEIQEFYELFLKDLVIRYDYFEYIKYYISASTSGLYNAVSQNGSNLRITLSVKDGQIMAVSISGSGLGYIETGYLIKNYELLDYDRILNHLNEKKD